MFKVTQNDTPKMVKVSTYTNKLSQNFTEHVRINLLFYNGHQEVEHQNIMRPLLQEAIFLSWLWSTSQYSPVQKESM